MKPTAEDCQASTPQQLNLESFLKESVGVHLMWQQYHSRRFLQHDLLGHQFFLDSVYSTVESLSSVVPIIVSII